MTLLACFLAYQLNWIRQRRELIKTGVVETYETPSEKSVAKRAPGLLYLFGEPGYHNVSVYMLDDDPELARVRELFPEAAVYWPQRPKP